jgi:hypothetical protein
MQKEPLVSFFGAPRAGGGGFETGGEDGPRRKEKSDKEGCGGCTQKMHRPVWRLRESGMGRDLCLMLMGVDLDVWCADHVRRADIETDLRRVFCGDDDR